MRLQPGQVTLAAIDDVLSHASRYDQDCDCQSDYCALLATVLAAIGTGELRGHDVQAAALRVAAVHSVSITR